MHDDDRDAHLLVQQVAAAAPRTPEHARLVAEAVERWSPLALRAASRYTRRTHEPEDLRQVALLGLLQAVLRYRPDRGPFPGWAVPWVVGEVRHWLRDQRGLVHVPRRVVELDVAAVAAEDDLVQRLHRTPTVAEVAHALGVGSEAVRSARAGRAARSVGVLTGDDAVPGPRRAAGRVVAGTVDEGAGLAAAEARLLVLPLLRGLDARSRRVLVLHFHAGRTQQEIARELGVSQAQVSRVLARAVGLLRQRLA